MIGKAAPTLADEYGPITIGGTASNNYGGSDDDQSRHGLLAEERRRRSPFPATSRIAAGGGAGPTWNTYLILKGSDQIASVGGDDLPRRSFLLLLF